MATAADVYSLADLVEAVRAELVAHQVPIAVAFGKQRTTPELHTKDEVRFLVEPGSDEWRAAAYVGHKNPQPVGLRLVGARAEITCRSTLEGAGTLTHERKMNAFVHAVLAALVVGFAVRKLGEFAPTRLGFVESDKELPYGARYDIEFQVPETVFRAAWPVLSPPIEHALDSVVVIDEVEIPVTSEE